MMEIKKYNKSKKKICIMLVTICIILVVIVSFNINSGQISRNDLVCNDDEVAKKINESAEIINFQGSILIAKDNEILYAAGLGKNDGEGSAENDANTVYAIGSVSKQFTAAAILMLCEDGSLQLSDTIDMYIDNWDADKKITIKQLLQMKSGLPRDFWEIAQNDSANFQQSSHTKGELLSLLNNCDLLFKPGSKYMYSNINYYLLSLIIEKVSEDAYENYIEDNIFKQCNMRDAFVNFKGNLVPGHYEGQRTRENADLYKGAGTVCASVYDIYEWVRCLHGDKVLSKKLYEQMITPEYGNYGFGLVVGENGTLWHNGQLNGYNSYVSYNKGSKLTIIVLSNSRTYTFRGQNGDFPAEVLAKTINAYLASKFSL